MTERAGPLAWISQALVELDRDDHRRHLQTRAGSQGGTIELNGERLLNFGSNDYLGLAGDERLRGPLPRRLKKKASGQAPAPWSTATARGTPGSERRLAEFEGAEAALVFNSGFAANLGTVAALVGREDAVFADQLNHASLIDGCRLSRAEIHVYPHRDMAAAGATAEHAPAISPAADRQRQRVQHGWRPGAAGSSGRAGRSPRLDAAGGRSARDRRLRCRVVAGRSKRLSAKSASDRSRRHVEQGAGSGRRICLGQPRAGRLAGESLAALRLFHRPAAGNCRGRAGRAGNHRTGSGRQAPGCWIAAPNSASD